MMRIFITTLVTLLFSLVVEAQPKAEWQTDKHDYGVINENDGDAVCEFTLINGGDSPLVITSARATCGCTQPRYSKDPIVPGDSTKITVSYDPMGRPGRFSKKIYINTNSEPQRSTLEISGVVIATENTIKNNYPVDAGKLRLQKSKMPLGEIFKKRMKTAFLDGYNITADSITPQWENVPEYMSVIPYPKVVPAGEQVAFTFYFNAMKCPTWGHVEDSLTLIPDASSELRIKIPVSAIVKESFNDMTPGQRINAPQIALSPEKIDMGIISPNSGILTAEFNIENHGKNQLEIRRIYTTEAGVEIDCNREKIKKGKHATVTVKIDTSKINAEMLNARIIIISNDPQRDSSIMRIVGEVKQ